MNIKQGLKLSAIVDKMDIKIENPNATSEEVGANLMLMFIKKAYKAEKEIYNFIADLKNISVEDAENQDLAKFLNELFGDAEMLGFLKSLSK
jgi:hypothetical protein